MAAPTSFIHFPLLPFEIREMIWHYTVLSSTTHFQDANFNTTISSGYPSHKDLATGTIITSRQQGPRPPSVAHTCWQARVATLQHHELFQTFTAPSGPLHRWDFSVTAFLLNTLHTNALLGKNHLATIARSAACVAIPVERFAEQGCIPAYLFELMIVANRVCPYAPKLVVGEFTVRTTRERAVASGLFGEKGQEGWQLIDVGNGLLLGKLAAMDPGARGSWVGPPAGWGEGVGCLTDGTYCRVLKESRVGPVEDMWLDCQASAVGGLGQGSHGRMLASGGRFRYRRDDGRVRRLLEKMPKFDVAFMANLCITSTG